MSANNFYFAHKQGKKWYGWDEMAEAWGDHDEHNPVVLHTKNADATGRTVRVLENALDMRGLGYAEYGLTTQPYLPKDGTPIKVIEDAEEDKPLVPAIIEDESDE